jgi:hypothetical protein
MNESEEPRETSASRVQAFAGRLRDIRGNLSYREMQRKSGCAHEKLESAAAGKKLPDWKTVEHYVTACGDDPAKLRSEWQAISAALGDRVTADDDTAAVPEHGTATPPHDHAARKEVDENRRARRLRPAALIVGSVVMVAGIIAVAVLVFSDDRSSGATHGGATTESTRSNQASLPQTTVSSPAATNPGREPRLYPSVTTGSSDDSPDPRFTTTVPTGTNTLDETNPADPDRQDNVQEQRVVELVQEQGYNWVDIEYWRHDASTPGEVQINTQEVFTNLGGKLTIIPDTPQAGRARCAQATGWRDRVSFSELHVGSQLCALSHLDHYASMEVRLLPNSPASNGKFSFYGITWWN